MRPPLPGTVPAACLRRNSRHPSRVGTTGSTGTGGGALARGDILPFPTRGGLPGGGAGAGAGPAAPRGAGETGAGGAGGRGSEPPPRYTSQPAATTARTTKAKKGADDFPPAT